MSEFVPRVDPLTDFLSIFATEPSRHLRLDEVTRHDMLTFMRSEFHGDERFVSLGVGAERHHYSGLIDKIVERSDCVFLWVGLVTWEILNPRWRSLIKGFIAFPEHWMTYSDGWSTPVIGKPEHMRAARLLLMMSLNRDLHGRNQWICIHSMMDEMTDNPSKLDTV